MVDIRQSTQYANYLKGNGWIVERIDEINYFIRKLPIIGCVLKIQRPKRIDFKTIDNLCRKYRIFQIIIEPKDSKDTEILASKCFKLSKSPFLPSKTLQIDLTQSEKVIFSHFKKDARRIVRKGSGQTIKSYLAPSDIKKWHTAWKNSVNLSRYVPGLQQLLNLRKSFPNNNSLFLASHNISSRIIGGALFTISSHENKNDTCYYWYGFTNSEGRTSLSQYTLLYQGILWAKKNNCKIFDFEGIYDSRFPNKSWLGFTHFKKSFGGVEVLYPGCYTKFQFPW
jgi:hypothetical protein